MEKKYKTVVNAREVTKFPPYLKVSLAEHQYLTILILECKHGYFL